MAHSSVCDVDKLAVAVDWLDACRTRDLARLLETYDPKATLECDCEQLSIRGREQIANYWRPKLSKPDRSAFELIQIVPWGKGVKLDYTSFRGEPIQAVMLIDGAGKITRTRCGRPERCRCEQLESTPTAPWS
jgi:hypothetical protein